MYKEKFVATIKTGGRILRENNPMMMLPRNKGSIIQLPFGSEYSILLKNLNTKKAKVNITIDGEDVLDGCSLLLDPKETLELKGFMSENIVKNRFRFIEKTKQISDYRGDRIDDGIIDITFSFEEPINQSTVLLRKLMETGKDDNWRNSHPTTAPMFMADTCDCKDRGFVDTIQIATNLLNSSDASQHYANQDCLYSYCVPDNDEGITVKGSQMHEEYNNGFIGKTGKQHNIVLCLVGKDSKNMIIQKPITTKTKFICETCGTRNRSNKKFCGECGTCLCD